MYSPLPGDELDSPLPGTSSAFPLFQSDGGAPVAGIATEDTPRPASRKRKGRKRDRESPENVVPPMPIPGTTRRIKLKVPPLAAVVQANHEANGTALVPVDPNEPVYCYCKQVSYGQVCVSLLQCPSPWSESLLQMIACDNDECAYEWVGSIVVFWR